MTNIADNLHIGAAPTGVGAVTSGGFGFGPVGRTYVYDIVPLALLANNIALSQSPATAALTLTAGAGVTKSVNSAGVTIYTLDVPRAVSITSGGNDSALHWTIKGYDIYGAPMTAAVTGANAGVATSLKAFSSIVSITPSASVATTALAGTADVFGLPVAVVDAAYITHAGWNNTLAANAGTLVVADGTIPSTTTTGDVRGTFAQAGAASNGSRRLVVTISLSDLNIGGDSEPAGMGQTVVGVLGQPQV